MNKRLTFLYFSAALVAGIIVACSGESSDTAAVPDIVAEPGEDTTAREFGYYERSAKHPYDNRLLNGWNLAKKKAKFVSYFCNTYQGTLFLSETIENPESSVQQDKNRYGLLDAKGNVLLPAEYQLIGNPGFLLDDYVEVKQDGKYGLYNYASRKLIRPEYDVIYPSRIMAYIAIGQKGSKLFKIYADGKSKPFGDDQPAPNYARLLKEYRYNTESEHYGFWTTTFALKELGSEDFYPWANSLIVTPSYLARLKIFPAAIEEVSNDWSEFGGDSVDVSLVDAKPRGEDIYSLLTSAYMYTADARGSENISRSLVTLDKRNSVKASKKILEFNSYDLQDFRFENVAKPRVRFVSDSVVEVRRYVISDKWKLQTFEADEKIPDYDNATADGSYRTYFNYTKYEYYLIGADGKVKVLADGVFPMTAAIVLTRDHFKGCFARLMQPEEVMMSELYDEDMGEDMPALSYTDHLSPADLEYMRNEIYARHGMKFKDQKWSATFAKFKWYKPTRSNVGSLLTPTEKKNLELIKKLETELKANPDALIHEEHDYIVFAG